MQPWHAHIPEIRGKARARSGCTLADLRQAAALLRDGWSKEALAVVNRRPRTDSVTRDFEHLVAQSCRVARGRDPISEGWTVVAVIILDLVPASWRSTGRGELTARARRAAQQAEPAAARPDVDNIEKAALDGASGQWFHGDAQVLPIPWRGWTVDPRRAGIHLLCWAAPTPAAAYDLIWGPSSPVSAWIRKLGALPPREGY